MKLNIVGSIALVLLCAGLTLSQQPRPARAPQPEPASAPPGVSPADEPPPQPGERAPQQPRPARGPAHQGPPPPGGDPFADNLFPPEMVMQHKRALNLSEEQDHAIREEMIKASTHFTELQFQIQDEMEAMIELTRSPAVDEQKAMAQLDKILNLEREVKRTQLLLAIRIKNKLTSDQQSRLREVQHNPPQPR